MTRSHSSTRNASDPGFRVEAPRASDAIGKALRGAFDDSREPRLPDDMMAMLRRLNGADTRGAY